MKKILRLFMDIMRDEKGFSPLAIAAGVGGLGGLIGSFGKSKRETIDPFAGFRKETADFLQNRLGQRTQFAKDPAFIQKQPGIEAAAERNIATRLASPITAQGITADITQKAFDAQRARQKELFDEEREATQNRFNRLGLVSSSPGLKAQSDLSEKQRIAGELLSSDLAVQQIESQLRALGLQEGFAAQTQAQALGLGQTQRGAQAQAQSFSLQDIQRQIDEELGFTRQASGFLTSQPAETFFRPGFAQRLGSGLQSAGQAGVNIALLSRLANAGTKTT